MPGWVPTLSTHKGIESTWLDIGLRNEEEKYVLAVSKNKIPGDGPCTGTFISMVKSLAYH